MKKDEKELKMFTLRMSKELWRFLRTAAINTDKSMAQIIIECLEKYKKKTEERLHKSDTNI